MYPSPFSNDLLSPISDMWEYYLPYLYSAISLCGVLLLLCEDTSTMSRPSAALAA